MIVDLPRRWSWVIGVATGCVIALAVMFVVATRPPGDALIAQAVAVVRSSVVTPNVVVAVAAPPASAAGTSVHGVDEVQVCGGNWVKLRDDGTPDEKDLLKAINMTQTRERIIAKLQADPAELSRATALVLKAPSSEESRDAVARLAVNSTDPRVYALGYKMCSNKRDAGACQLINARRWAQLDANDATPWLYLLDEAKTRGDRGAQDEALHRIATAQRSDNFFFATSGAIVDAAPATDAALPTTYAMVGEATGIEAATTMGGYSAVVAACKGDALRDSNRAQTCAGIADVLTDRSATLIDRIIGIAIGRNIGWPPDRLELARAESNAYQATLRPSDPDDDYSCGPLRRVITRVRRSVDVGETGVMREWIAQSGKTPQDFIDADRDNARRAAEAASAAAGSASNPASSPGAATAAVSASASASAPHP